MGETLQIYSFFLKEHYVFPEKLYFLTYKGTYFLLFPVKNLITPFHDLDDDTLTAVIKNLGPEAITASDPLQT